MIVENDYINRRLDKYLRDKCGYLQSQICILSKQSRLLVNNTPKNFNYRLQKNDTINIIDNKFKQVSVNNSKVKDKKTKTLPTEMVYKLQQSIIYEDKNILVINKPYGVSVQGGTGVKYNLEDYFSILSDNKLRIVHRIDKDTSGILILAKSSK